MSGSCAWQSRLPWARPKHTVVSEASDVVQVATKPSSVTVMSSASGGVALAAVAANPVKASAAARTTLPRFNLAVRNLGARLHHRDIHTHLTLIAASARKSSRLEWSLAATATARRSQGAFASKSKDTHKRLREEIADLDRRIGLQIDALEQGIEPELVGERIAQLRLEKEQAEAALRDVAPDTAEPDADELIAALSRVPDLSQAVRDAPMELKRQVFEAFCLRSATTRWSGASRSRRRSPRPWRRPSRTRKTSRRRSIA